MNISKKLSVTGVSMLLVLGLAACDKKNGDDPIGSSTNDGQVQNDTDHIKNDLDNAGQKLENKLDKAEENLDDAAITAKIKAAILAEPGLKSLQISVDTVQNVTTLTGTVDSQQSSDKAQQVAAAVSGVKAVENKLGIQPSS
jgi:predicted amino acid-binding ACT domain protein